MASLLGLTVLVLALCAPFAVLGTALLDPNFSTGVYTLPGLSHFTTFGAIYPGACVQNFSPTETDLVAIPWPNNNFDWAFCGACFQFTNQANNNSAIAKIVDWWDQGTDIYSYGWYMCGYPNNSPYNTICPSGTACNKIDVQLVECPYTTIELYFTQWNDAMDIFVEPLYHNVPFYNCSYNDTTMAAGTVEWLTPGGPWTLQGTKVNIPFTLTFGSIVGEVVPITVTGLQGIPGGWPVGGNHLPDYGYYNVTYPTSQQTTVGFSGIVTTGGTGASSSSATVSPKLREMYDLLASLLPYAVDVKNPNKKDMKYRTLLHDLP